MIRQQGYSLIEFMIASAISLVVLAAMSAVFVGSMRTQNEMSRTNQQLENGRMAMEMLSEDLQLAGYYGEFDAFLAAATMDMPAALPNPCLTDLADLDLGLPFHIQGYDNVSSSSPLSCLSDVKTGTDMLVIRRTSTCVGGTAECDMVSGAPYFQASLCSDSTELESTDSDAWFRLDTSLSNLDRTKRDCDANDVADARRFRVHIYYIANNYQNSDGIPTLKLAELRGGSFVHYPLAFGIESVHYEYGIDNDQDGSADAYAADPGLWNGCAAAAGCTMANWRDVTAVKINMLVRALDKTPFYSDNRYYHFGVKADGTSSEYVWKDDGYKRNIYNSLVRLNNAVVRRR